MFMSQFAAQRLELRHVPNRHEHSEHHICYELPGNSHPSVSSLQFFDFGALFFVAFPAFRI